MLLKPYLRYKESPKVLNFSASSANLFQIPSNVLQLFISMYIKKANKSFHRKKSPEKTSWQKKVTPNKSNNLNVNQRYSNHDKTATTS